MITRHLIADWIESVQLLTGREESLAPQRAPTAPATSAGSPPPTKRARHTKADDDDDAFAHPFAAAMPKTPPETADSGRSTPLRASLKRNNDEIGAGEPGGDGDDEPAASEHSISVSVPIPVLGMTLSWPCSACVNYC